MNDERNAIQSNLEHLSGTIDSLGTEMRQGLAKFLRASPAAQAAAMATSPETAVVFPILLRQLRMHPEFRPLLLSLLEGG